MKIFNIIIAIAAGLIVLLGYFFPSPAIQSLRTPLLDWAVTLSGVAGLVAILNLIFGIHWKRVREDKKSKGSSFVIILAFILTLIAGILLGPSSVGFQKIVTVVQVPIESSLMAVLAITMAYSSIKLLQRQRNWMGFIFFISVVVFLVLNSGILAFTTDIPLLRDVLSGFHQVPVAGARGILLGIALGSVVTGIRVLIGSDHPYNG
jgi:ABC-type transport system involved in cytochrome c biogenesis permease subunit